nr:hypothetical protein Iba_chr02aCG11890 [Ipomoea batatas]
MEPRTPCRKLKLFASSMGCDQPPTGRSSGHLASAVPPLATPTTPPTIPTRAAIVANRRTSAEVW